MLQRTASESGRRLAAAVQILARWTNGWRQGMLRCGISAVEPPGRQHPVVRPDRNPVPTRRNLGTDGFRSSPLDRNTHVYAISQYTQFDKGHTNPWRPELFEHDARNRLRHLFQKAESNSSQLNSNPFRHRC